MAVGPRGEHFYKFGGDSGETMHDAQFCVNGLLFPDRTPHPAMFEVRHVFRPVHASFVAWQPDDALANAPASTASSTSSSASNASAADAAAPPGTTPFRALVRITNRYETLTLSHLRLSAVLEADGAPLASLPPRHLGAEERGTLHSLAQLQPRESLTVELPLVLDAAAYATPPRDVCLEFALTLQFALALPTAWGEAGHEVAREQFKVPLPPLKAGWEQRAGVPVPSEVGAAAAAVALRVEQSAQCFVLSGVGMGGVPFSYRVCRHSGALALRVRGALVVEEASGLQLWRAPTDNDRANTLFSISRPTIESIAQMPWYMRLFFALPGRVLGVLDPNCHSYDDLWRAVGLHNTVQTLESIELTSQTAFVAELRAMYALRPPKQARSSRALALHELRIRVHADGEVELLNEAHVPVAVPSLPRVGLLLGLPARLERCRWYGLGPHENYVDRQRGAALAVHTAAVDELFTPYLVPGECGHRGGLRWLEVSDAVGTGVRVSGAGGALGFSLLRYSAVQLDGAAHPHELEPDPRRLWLSLDHRMMGAGGDTGWTRSVHAPYRVPPGTYRWALALRPLADEAHAHATRGANGARARAAARAWLVERGPAYEPLPPQRPLVALLVLFVVLLLARVAVQSQIVFVV